MLEEVLPQIALDPATDPVQDLPHSEPGRPSQKGGGHDQKGVAADAGLGHIGIAEIVDGLPHQVGTGDSEEVGDHHHGQTHPNAPDVGA